VGGSDIPRLALVHVTSAPKLGVRQARRVDQLLRLKLRQHLDPASTQLYLLDLSRLLLTTSCLDRTLPSPHASWPTDTRSRSPHSRPGKHLWPLRERRSLIVAQRKAGADRYGEYT
jgi:hypothetical protein